MSSWKDVEKVVIKTLEEGGKRIQEKLSVTPEEKLLTQRAKRKQGWEGHRNAYVLVNIAVWLFSILVLHNVRLTFLAGGMTIFWGMGLAFHTLAYRAWLSQHRAPLQVAESAIRAQGKVSAYHLLENPPAVSSLESGAVVDASTSNPLLARCLAAAEQTRKSLHDLGPAEVEALAVVDEGMERIKGLLTQQESIQRALEQAQPHTLESDRARIAQRLQASTDADTITLYQSQLEMLEARAQKVKALAGLMERIEAYAESYLTALTNLRMDAAQIRAADMPGGSELTKQLQSARQLERQMEGMRQAAQEVTRHIGSR